MNVRSITCFLNVEAEGEAALIARAGRLVDRARAALEAAAFPVETARLATQPLSYLAGDPLQVASRLWAHCQRAGLSYLSVGPVLAAERDADLSLIPGLRALIQDNESVFAGVLVAQRGQGLNLEAVGRSAQLIHDIAQTTDLGFGNLRLAVLANVGPLSPFFPAGYHDGGPPAVAIATAAADLAVRAFSQAGSLEEARAEFIRAVEVSAGQIAGVVRPLCEEYGFRFAGLDFSPAPFPEEARSIGKAIENLGVDRFGAPGTLFAAQLITDCLRRANYARCGFNGLMLPVLEDATLAARSAEGLFTVNDLLLYSAVCGTGLDTVPLPGDVGVDELAAILLDVATLALRLDKPLTARLMPVPGAAAGDLTPFDFPYFATGRVLSVKGLGSRRLFERARWLAM